jgi:large subunit ribosomal protein L3
VIALIGQKGSMSQLYDEQGRVRPVTAIEVGECVVVRKRTKTLDGYDALQLGFGKPSKRQATKPVQGHYRKAGLEPMGVLREVRVDKIDDYQVGQRLGVGVFKTGDVVSVTGTTKGRGFTGGMKRWGWHGGPASHGHTSHRRIGSLGSGTSPGRVLRGRTLPGHYGVERVTVRNLKVFRAEPEKGIVYVTGAVPGYRGGVVLIRRSS